MQNNCKQKITSSKRRAISPILATVVLLGITVVAGGLVFAVFSTSANTASTTNSIVIENAQAVKGTSHADLTATIKNGGGKPWTTIEMTVAKSDLSEPLLYESLHENVRGCSASCYTSTTLASGANLDNPLRSQWIASLDKTGGTANIADIGEGISAGRKFVISTSDPSVRDTLILPGTSIYKQMANSPTTERTSSNIITASFCTPAAGAPSDCTDYFKALDSSTKDKIFCNKLTVADNGTEAFSCKVATHQKINSPIASGSSVQIYADAFTKTVTGLNNQFVQSGDNLVTNIVTKDADGGSARVQTIIKVTGV
ncbi:MAG: archaellin/type IV pilin N-terminal domain-containing protein [Nitrosarchaeum sp.]